jgi:hypothetical protein
MRTTGKQGIGGIDGFAGQAAAGTAEPLLKLQERGNMASLNLQKKWLPPPLLSIQS